MSFSADDFDQLKRSLLFNLSLSSKELFHSNIIKWCCDNWPNEMNFILHKLIHGLPPAKSIIKTERERNHHDLEILFDNGIKLIVELKIKSIPQKEQLIRYSNKAKSNEILVLLCFYSNSFDTNICPIIDISLLGVNIISEIADKCSEISCYQKFILYDYAELIFNLRSLLNQYELDDNTPFYFESELLNELHIHDIIYKYRHDQLCEMIRTKIKTYGIDAKKIPWKEGQNREFLCESGFTNGTGLTSLGYIFSGTNSNYECIICIGIQLQGRQFRQFINCFPIDSNQNKAFEQYAIKIAENVFQEKIWFIFDNEIFQKEIWMRNAMRKTFCNYNNLFYHRYVTISRNNNICVSDLIEIILKLILSIEKNEIKIKKIVDNILISKN